MKKLTSRKQLNSLKSRGTKSNQISFMEFLENLITTMANKDATIFEALIDLSERYPNVTICVLFSEKFVRDHDDDKVLKDAYQRVITQPEEMVSRGFMETIVNGVKSIFGTAQKEISRKVMETARVVVNTDSGMFLFTKIFLI